LTQSDVLLSGVGQYINPHQVLGSYSKIGRFYILSGAGHPRQNLYPRFMLVFLLSMKLVSLKMPDMLVEGMDELVRRGLYPSRSAVMRAAVRDLLKKELWSNVEG
jgi:antitoxin ParD1/3/4